MREPIDLNKITEQATERLKEILDRHGAHGQPSPFETLDHFAERTGSQVFKDVDELKARLRRGYLMLMEGVDGST